MAVFLPGIRRRMWDGKQSKAGPPVLPPTAPLSREGTRQALRSGGGDLGADEVSRVASSIVIGPEGMIGPTGIG